MNAISLPELEPDLQDWLSRRAAARGVSLAEEVQSILSATRDGDASGPAVDWQAALAEPMPLPPGCPPSLESSGVCATRGNRNATPAGGGCLGGGGLDYG